MCVSTFRNPRIEAYLQLPAAYRSLSRLSSAPDAKAFPLCSSLLLLLFAYAQISSCLWSFSFSLKNCWVLKNSFVFRFVFFSPFSQLLVRLKLFFYPLMLNFTWKDQIDFFIFLSFSLANLFLLAFSVFRVLINLFSLLYSVFNEHFLNLIIH